MAWRQMLFRSAAFRKLNRRLDNYQRAHPPRCPPGWSTGPPHFIGLGAQRCGTTWWYRLITEHPDVRRRRPKELHFFERASRGLIPGVEVEDYHRFFPRPAGAIVGEWTPGYMFRPEVPPLIAQVAPEAKFLALLRDPVERYLSGVTFQSDFPGGATEAALEHAVARGRYGTQLENCYSHLDRGAILVLQHERCVADPGGEIARTYTWLGLDPSFVPRSLNRRINAVRKEKLQVAPERRAELVERYSDDVIQLLELVPTLDVSLWPNFRHLSTP